MANSSSPKPPPPSTKMLTIGIIGGSTDLATAEYYKLINARIRAELGGLHTGEIIINSMDCAMSTHFVQKNLWDEGAQYIHSKATSLERAGVDFILCVSNTWHRVCDVWMKGVGVPLLHIADPTAEAIKRAGIGEVALLGTRATMSSEYLRGYFEERHGVKVVVPSDVEQRFIDRVIFEELALGKFTDESRRGYLKIIDEMEKKGAKGVILGCTEIPLLVRQEDRPGMPMFDTLRLHAEAAAMRAVAG